jgi:meiotically up-regulated gene 157 (Mug157) protein
MSLLLQAMTSDHDLEITECLNLVLKASPLGLVHESINVNHIRDYTRSWFACRFPFHYYFFIPRLP